jgi:imidazolonepropionase-like amidohydrolase
MRIETAVRAGSFALVSLLVLYCGVVDRREQSLVITHVTVIDATGRPPMADMSVVIVGERIERIAPAHIVSLTPAAKEIDGSGKYLIPGLWDMHAHLSLYGEASLSEMIRNGVTGVLDLGGDLTQLDHWSDEVRNGQRPGPRIYRAGPFVDGYKSNAVSGRQSSTLTVGNAEEARQAVQRLKKQGVDVIKVHNAIPRDAFFALAKEARGQSLPFVTHLPQSVSAREASESGAKSLQHTETLLESAIYHNGASTIEEAIVLVKGEHGQALFDYLASNSTWFVPTLVAYYRLVVQSQLSPEETEAAKALHRELVAVVGAMNRSGVRLLAGSDCAWEDIGIQPGVDIHAEIAFLVEAGLIPMAALRTATALPAEFLGLSDTLGTIEVGKIADLLLVRQDPTENIENTRSIDAVIVGGNLVFSGKGGDSSYETQNSK